MKNPGYVMVNWSGIDLSASDAQKWPDGYQRMERVYNYGKQIFVYGAITDNAVASPIPAVVVKNGQQYNVELPIASYTVKSDDTITLVTA